LSLQYRTELSTLRYVHIDPFPVKLDNNIQSIAIIGIRDARENLFNTTRSRYFEIRNKLAENSLLIKCTFVGSVIIGKVLENS